MLTKTDLGAIKKIVQEESRRTNKRLDKMDKKIDMLFNFLDKEVVSLKNRAKKAEKYLRLPTSA